MYKLFCVFVFFVALPTLHAVPINPDGGYYYIINDKTGKMLDANTGAYPQLDDSHPRPFFINEAPGNRNNHMWYLKPVGTDTFTMTSCMSPNYCLDGNADAHIRQYDSRYKVPFMHKCQVTLNHNWKILPKDQDWYQGENTFTLQNQYNHLYLDGNETVPNKDSNFKNPFLIPVAPVETQKWIMLPAQTFTIPATPLVPYLPFWWIQESMVINSISYPSGFGTKTGFTVNNGNRIINDRTGTSSKGLIILFLNIENRPKLGYAFPYSIYTNIWGPCMNGKITFPFLRCACNFGWAGGDCNSKWLITLPQGQTTFSPLTFVTEHDRYSSCTIHTGAEYPSFPCVITSNNQIVMPTSMHMAFTPHTEQVVGLTVGSSPEMKIPFQFFMDKVGYEAGIVCIHGEIQRDYTCKCEHQWTGPDCNTPICNEPCVKGKCVQASISSHECKCDRYYGGNTCNARLCTLEGLSGRQTSYPVDGGMLIRWFFTSPVLEGWVKNTLYSSQDCYRTHDNYYPLKSMSELPEDEWIDYADDALGIFISIVSILA